MYVRLLRREVFDWVAILYSQEYETEPDTPQKERLKLSMSMTSAAPNDEDGDEPSGRGEKDS